MEKLYTIRRNKPARPSSFLEKIFIEQKLNNVIGYGVAVIIAGVFGYLIAKETLVGLEIFAAIFGFFVLMTCMLSTEAGFYINIFYSFFIYAINRYLFREEFQVGIISDLLICATFLSLFIRRTEVGKKFREFTRSAIVVVILLYACYLLVELGNPYANSVSGWFQTFRRFALSLFLLFISYNVFSNYAAIRRFVIILFVFCFIVGLYGCIQQWHGFFDFELAVIFNNKDGWKVVFINGGELRKFSTMSDPMSYGTVMAACILFFVVIAVNVKRFKYRAWLFIGCIFMALGMVYSGTRTANVMLVVGIALYALLTINRKQTKIFIAVAGFLFLFLLYVPIYNNGPLNRFRSSFVGGGDASFDVREQNRHLIQPYIYKHPIGGGLCTTGDPGERFNPGHYLAGFPPDSGYLRKALETGWIGLIFIFVVYFVTLRSCVRGYFASHNERRKTLYAAALAFLFSFYVAEFAQEALGQITDMVVYYPIIAMIVRLRNLDKKGEELAYSQSA
jgi:putative inorganic carbon (hco3(-)) transporter